MASNDETNEAEISSLFNDARDKLDGINKEAKKEKKQVIIQLAKDLDGKIPTDTISIEIVNQLRGKVSERFIRKCLDEKYKQNHRAENARKQRKRQQQECNENHLAALVPPNQESKSKEIMVDVDGRSVEEDELETSPTIDTSSIDGTFAKASSHKQDLTKQVNHGLKECSSCKELYSENLELKEALENAGQLITADNMVSVSSLSTSPSSTACTDYNHHRVNDILEVEFPVFFEDLRQCLEDIFRITKGVGKIWIRVQLHGKNVIMTFTGGSKEHQIRLPESSIRTKISE